MDVFPDDLGGEGLAQLAGHEGGGGPPAGAGQSIGSSSLCQDMGPHPLKGVEAR